jgi:hypothetical protein
MSNDGNWSGLDRALKERGVDLLKLHQQTEAGSAVVATSLLEESFELFSSLICFI